MAGAAAPRYAPCSPSICWPRFASCARTASRFGFRCRQWRRCSARRTCSSRTSLPSLRWSLFCGEALPGATAEAGKRSPQLDGREPLWPHRVDHRLHRVPLGPGELPPAECVNGMVPIGRPYEKLDAIVVGMKERAAGSRGRRRGRSAAVAGPQTFQGYWRDPAKTVERTFQRPTPAGGLATYYRTGHRVRYLPSGNLAYLGRVDHQVKVNGYRVELSEIEGVLAQQPVVWPSRWAGPSRKGRPRASSPSCWGRGWILTLWSTRPASSCPPTWCRARSARSMPCPSTRTARSIVRSCSVA